MGVFLYLNHFLNDEIDFERTKHILEKKICDICNGDGLVTIKETEKNIDCPACSGTGYKKIWEEKKEEIKCVVKGIEINKNQMYYKLDDDINDYNKIGNYIIINCKDCYYYEMFNKNECGILNKTVDSDFGCKKFKRG